MMSRTTRFLIGAMALFVAVPIAVATTASLAKADPIPIVSPLSNQVTHAYGMGSVDKRMQLVLIKAADFGGDEYLVDRSDPLVNVAAKANNYATTINAVMKFKGVTNDKAMMQARAPANNATANDDAYIHGNTAAFLDSTISDFVSPGIVSAAMTRTRSTSRAAGYRIVPTKQSAMQTAKEGSVAHRVGGLGVAWA
jgi:hypothetical protein